VNARSQFILYFQPKRFILGKKIAYNLKTTVEILMQFYMAVHLTGMLLMWVAGELC